MRSKTQQYPPPKKKERKKKERKKKVNNFAICGSHICIAEHSHICAAEQSNLLERQAVSPGTQQTACRKISPFPPPLSQALVDPA